DSDIADEVNTGALRDLVVALADGLQRLMVRRDPKADEPVGDWIAVEDVDARLIAICFLKRLGRVEARRARTDYREMPHAASSDPGTLAATPASVSPCCDPPAGRCPSS